MYYQDLFNQNYINKNEYERILLQKAYINQMVRIDEEQQKEIEKMTKALNDFFDAAEKIIPQYQNKANTMCILEIYKRFYKNNNQKDRG